MNESAHRKATQAAVWIADAILENTWAGSHAQRLMDASAQTDMREDLEFVDVAGARENPHTAPRRIGQDSPHTQSDGRCHSAFNHYIDIKKGPGLFDDFDGYSYYHGSAHMDQYQQAVDVTAGWGLVVAHLTGFKVDEGIAYWLNDEYVHAPGQPWYQKCSPALERYSYRADLKRYTQLRTEMRARFPLAKSQGGNGQGIPYSVFMPVDNMARYWFHEFLREPTQIESLGPVLHAVQDASVPHHAAGYHGNWHAEYEQALDVLASQVETQAHFLPEVNALVTHWNRRRPENKRALRWPTDQRRSPERGWSIQDLVTWQACKSYQEYARTYRHFRSGFQRQADSMQRLYTQAVALGALVLIKAYRETHPKTKLR